VPSLNFIEPMYAVVQELFVVLFRFVLNWQSYLAASPCLKAFMLPGGPLLPFNPAISFLPTWQDSFSHSCFIMAK
jgi:hypothetical protein